MRKKFILIRTVPLLVIFILLAFIIKNDLLHSYELDTNSTRGQQSSSFGDEGNSIYDVIDSINSMLRRRAYSDSQVNLTTLYESLSLTKSNLARYGYLCESASGNVFVGLMSKADSFERRNLIRDTLGKQVNQSNQKMLFFVGESRNETVNELVDEEMAINQDVVRLELVVEDYYNLTLKVPVGLLSSMLRQNLPIVLLFRITYAVIGLFNLLRLWRFSSTSTTTATISSSPSNWTMMCS